MENFLSSFENKSTRQKVLIVFGVTIFLLLFISIMFVISTPKKVGNKTSAPGVHINSGTSLPASENKNIKWKSFSNQYYKFTYPSDWFIDEFDVVQGGISTAVKLPHGNNDAYPRFDVSVFPVKNSNDLATRAAGIKKFGFVQTSEKFLGNDAIKLVTITNGKSFLTMNPLKKDVEKVLYLFQKGSLIYEIDYSYYLDSSANNIISVMNEIISSVIIP